MKNPKLKLFVPLYLNFEHYVLHKYIKLAVFLMW